MKNTNAAEVGLGGARAARLAAPPAAPERLGWPR
jgi:hypothetical protein